MTFKPCSVHLQRLQRLVCKLQPKREAAQEDAVDSDQAVVSGNRDASASLLPGHDRCAARKTPLRLCVAANALCWLCCRAARLARAGWYMLSSL